MKVLLSIFLLMSLVACSGSKSTNEAEGTDAETELAENDEFSEDFSEDEGGELDEIAEDDESGDDAIEEVQEDEVADEAMEEEPAQAMDQANEMEEVAESAPAPVQVNTSGEEGWHTVSRSETLMIIAFKIYGDYDRWRDLARWNAGKLGTNHSLSVGMKLKFEAPAQKFVWSPDGNPYLIKVGDTLGTISNDTYGTNAYWKNIWQNNKPLIKNPNRIFAGFTIYTPLIEGRGVANQ
ncbi:MAG: nucleoid-associated protein YgaU [Bacteriovoracaceae bacterium]|jgi:nucleoid-associated protein YgaU